MPTKLTPETMTREQLIAYCDGQNSIIKILQKTLTDALDRVVELELKTRRALTKKVD